MQQGRGGMGSHKHGISGGPGRNSLFKALTVREAHKDEHRRRRRRQALSLSASTVAEAMAQARPR